MPRFLPFPSMKHYICLRERSMERKDEGSVLNSGAVDF